MWFSSQSCGAEYKYNSLQESVKYVYLNAVHCGFVLVFFSKCAQGLVHLELGRLRAGSWLSSRKTSQNNQVSDKFLHIKWSREGQGTGMHVRLSLL